MLLLSPLGVFFLGVFFALIPILLIKKISMVRILKSQGLEAVHVDHGEYLCALERGGQ